MQGRPLLTAFSLAAFLATCLAQDRLPTMPRYDRYEKLRQQISGSVTGGQVYVSWAPDGKSFAFSKDGRNVRYVLATGEVVEDHGIPAAPGPIRRRARPTGVPERGRQFSTAVTADGKTRAVCVDRNIFIGPVDGDTKFQLTTEGSVEKRIKCGMASWVYGEELDQREAMWWSPDGKKLAYYRFDESQVPDYYVTLHETAVQDVLDTEAYPKAGAPNPIADLMVYDFPTKKTTKLDVRFKSPLDPDLGEYVYNVRWSDDGKSILFFRMNRKQNAMQFVAADPDTGVCRVLVSESNPNGWVDYRTSTLWTDADGNVTVPSKDGKPTFLWISERNGYRNLYLYDFAGNLVRQLTNNNFDLESIVKVTQGSIWYTAHDGDVPAKIQLHRVSIDGGGDRRLTAPELSHTPSVAPDGEHFVDVEQAVDVPPKTVLCDRDGHILSVLAMSNLAKWDSLGLKKVERIKFKAADGKTDLYGFVSYPSDFDPSKKYPVIVNVYAGPESGSGADRFQTPDPITEFGFVVAWFDGRGTNGRGRDFQQCLYRKLGTIEIDDQAAGVKYLRSRPYIDGSRVGIQGTSYGGYASLMALLRYPDVFKAACSSSPVTDWRNYDSTYTERYMDLPQDNTAGYDAGSAMTYAKNLKGNLMLYFGTADNNVHPSNSIQMVQALERNGKYFEMMVGADKGHSQVNSTLMWEFFIQHLILERQKPAVSNVWDDRAIGQRLTRKK